MFRFLNLAGVCCLSFHETRGVHSSPHLRIACLEVFGVADCYGCRDTKEETKPQQNDFLYYLLFIIYYLLYILLFIIYYLLFSSLTSDCKRRGPLLVFSNSSFSTIQASSCSHIVYSTLLLSTPHSFLLYCYSTQEVYKG